MSVLSSFDVPSLHDRLISLAPGTRRNFTYDWDDIQISELLIVPRSGAARQLIIDPNPTERQYHPPEQNAFVIPKLDTLPTATPEVSAALKESRTGLALLWVLALLGVVAPFGLLFAITKLTILKREAGKQVTQSG